MLSTILMMSALLGLSSFGFGILPLSFIFSKSHLDRLSALGTGLLLGTALGVIIPEGIETIVEAHPNSEPPTSRIALSLIIGFTLMLLIEQLVTPGAHSHGPEQLQLEIQKPHLSRDSAEVHFDADLEDIERQQRASPSGYREIDASSLKSGSPELAAGVRAFPLTFGLVIHALADGLALGVSSLSNADPEKASNVSLIVFLALIIHKAPTSLALTMSLLSSNLSRGECRKHLAIFASATPFAAVLSYMLFSSIGEGVGGSWTGEALLLSGGTFLYVATVLQPVSQHSESSAGDMAAASRVFFIIIGMFTPFLLGTLLGHGH